MEGEEVEWGQFEEGRGPQCDLSGMLLLVAAWLKLTPCVLLFQEKDLSMLLFNAPSFSPLSILFFFSK